jgi:hypothetical protein
MKEEEAGPTAIRHGEILININIVIISDPRFLLPMAVRFLCVALRTDTV